MYILQELFEMKWCSVNLYILNSYLQRLQAALDGVVQENADLLSKVRHLHQELVNERTLLCHITADKVDVEHQLHVSLAFWYN